MTENSIDELLSHLDTRFAILRADTREQTRHLDARLDRVVHEQNLQAIRIVALEGAATSAATAAATHSAPASASTGISAKAVGSIALITTVITTVIAAVVDAITMRGK